MKFGSIFGAFFIKICVEIEKRDFVKFVLPSRRNTSFFKLEVSKIAEKHLKFYTFFYYNFKTKFGEIFNGFGS